MRCCEDLNGVLLCKKEKKNLSLDNFYKLSVPVSSLFYGVEVRGVVTLVNKLIFGCVMFLPGGKTGYWALDNIHPILTFS